MRRLSLLTRLLMLAFLAFGTSRAADRYRILILYTPGADSVLHDMKHASDSLIAQLNTSYSNNDIDIEAELAGVFSVPVSGFTEADYPGNILSFVSPGATWHKAFQKRYAADLIMVLFGRDPASGGGAGICGGGLDNGNADTTWNFGAANVNKGGHNHCDAQHPFPENVARLFATNEIYVTSTYYARGECSDAEGMRTIGSAYHSGATSLPPGRSCTNTNYILYYSDPLSDWPGGSTPMGIADTADLTRAIRTRIADIKNLATPWNYLSLPSTVTSSGVTSRTGSIIQANEYADANAVDSMRIEKGFTIDSGASARFRSGGTIRVDSGFHVKAGAGPVVFQVSNSPVFAKQTARGIPKPVQAFEVAMGNAYVRDGQLHLAYTLEKGGPVALELFGLDGRRLRSWIWSEAKAGNLERSFDIGNLPRRGLLFLQWRAGDKHFTQKIFVK